MREWQLPPERTESDLRWAASWRKHGADVARLESNPDALRAFVARCRLRARPGIPPAAGCAESSLTAGALRTAGSPGPASVVGIS